MGNRIWIVVLLVVVAALQASLYLGLGRHDTKPATQSHTPQIAKPFGNLRSSLDSPSEPDANAAFLARAERIAAQRPGADRPERVRQLIKEWCAVEPEACILYLLQKKGAYPIPREFVRLAFAEWAETDLPGALDLATELTKAEASLSEVILPPLLEKLRHAQGIEAVLAYLATLPQTRQIYLGAIPTLSAFIKDDPIAGETLLARIPIEAERERYAFMVGFFKALSRGAIALNEIPSGVSLTPVQVAQLTGMIGSLLRTDRVLTVNWLLQQPASPHFDRALTDAAQRLAIDGDPKQGLLLAEKIVDPAIRARIADRVIDEWGHRDGETEEITNWAAASNIEPEVVAAPLARLQAERAASPRNFRAEIDAAAGIASERVRIRNQWTVFNSWAARDLPAAEAWFASADIPQKYRVGFQIVIDHRRQTPLNSR